MGPGLAQLVEHLTVVGRAYLVVGIKLSLVRFRQPGTVFL
jgi:hypothetical protein